MGEPGSVAVIGGGLIGAAWSALLVHHGHVVRAFDPDARCRADLADRVDRLRAQLVALAPALDGSLSVVDSLQEAVGQASFILESAPERIDLKIDLLRAIDAAAPARSVVATSTSSLLLSEMVRDVQFKARCIVAHPFNPPHLMPLVELFGTDGGVLDRAETFFRALGKVTVRLRKEVPGHIANRLGAALWQEAVHLVASGVADVADIDAALIHGPAMRWAVQGTHLTYHLGGGAGGIRHYLDHLGPSQERRWASLGKVELTPAVKKLLIAGIESEAAGRSIAELEAERDRFLIDLLKLRDHL